jgi:NAD+ synthase (glutamine-hydrolysing)
MNAALVQSNLLVGDVEGNARIIRREYERSVARGAELIVSTELALTGYPPRDLLLREDVLRRQIAALKALASITGTAPLVVGFAEPNTSGRRKPLFNSVAVACGGSVVAVRRKTLLPTYDVFDEHRYFEPLGERQGPVELCGQRVAFLICEDIWGGVEDPDRGGRAPHDPVAWAADGDPDLLVVINASPYWWGKGDVRRDLVARVARRAGCPVAFANQVGGNDELIFDGHSFAVDSSGELIAAAHAFDEQTLLFSTSSPAAAGWETDTGSLAALEAALVLGLRDYVRKVQAFPGGALVGISGGLDSAVVAQLAVRALGSAKVVGVTMPSRFSSPAGLDDARAVATWLGIGLREIPIHDLYECFGDALGPQIGWRELPTVTEENVQARIRAALLMAIANREQRIVLGTGNKSELAMGYCTLYGDMAAGLGVISDLPKTTVRQLAAHMSAEGLRIPERVLSKPPSAELRPDQRDTDTLPEYSTLDPLLEAYVERQMDPDQLVGSGFDRTLVRRVVEGVDRAEFKRRQMAPGLKVTAKAFGTGRCMPIAAARSFERGTSGSA